MIIKELVHIKKLNVLRNQYSRHSLNFDGVDERVDVPHIAAHDVGADDTFSMSMWVKIDNAGHVHGLLRKGVTSTGINLLAINTNRGIIIRLRGGAYADGQTLEVYSPNSVIPINIWTHICFTYDATRSNIPPLEAIKFFVNGVKVTTSTPTARRSLGIAYDFFNTGVLTLGQGAGGEKLEGNMDEFRFWNRELTTQEVIDDYNFGKPTLVQGAPGPILDCQLGDNAIIVGPNFTMPDVTGNTTPLTPINMEVIDIKIDSPPS